MGDAIDLPNIFCIWMPMEEKADSFVSPVIRQREPGTGPSNIIDDITKGYGFLPCDSR